MKLSLTELRARPLTATTGQWHEIAFLCPRCQSHEIAVAFWSGAPGNVQVGHTEEGAPIIQRMWHQEGDDFDTLSLTPSINREGLGDKCGGWHGFITNGEAK